MNILLEAETSQSRFINELISEIGLPPLAQIIPTKDEDGIDNPMNVGIDPQLLSFLVKNENNLKKQIVRDGGLKLAPPTNRKINIRPLYYTLDVDLGLGIIAPDKNNELALYYMERMTGGGSFVTPLERLKIFLIAFYRRNIRSIFIRPEHKAIYNNLNLVNLSNYTRFSDEPKDSVFLEVQSTLQFLNLPPMVYSDFMDSGPNDDRDSPDVEAQRILNRLSLIRKEILTQIAKEGYIREMEGGCENEPIYFCHHKIYGFGLITRTAMGLRVAFVENMKSVVAEE